MVSVLLYPCLFCVGLSMDMFVLCVACLTVFVNFLVKQFAICLGVVVISLLNVMVLFRVIGSTLLDRPCLVFQSVCVCCACDPSERLDAHSICLCFCMLNVISSFTSLRAGSQVFSLLMLSLV